MKMRRIDVLAPSTILVSVAFCGLSLFYEYRLLRNITISAENINISGRQRMLSQRASFLSTLQKIQDHTEYIDPEYDSLLESSLDAALDALTTANGQLPSFCSGAKCEELNHRVSESLVQLTDGLDESPRTVFTNANDFLSNMEMMVQFLEDETKESILLIRNVISTLQVVGVITVSLVTILYYILTKKRNKKETKKIERMVQYLFHEIRNPLNHVVSGIDHILSTHQGVAENTRSELNQCAVGGVMITSILNDVLTLASVESKKYQIDTRPCYLRKVISDAVQITSLTANSSETTVEMDIPDDVGVYDIDFVKLSQVMMNLITNAVKYCGHGNNVLVGVKKVYSGVFKDTVNFYVSDNGPGISPKMQRVIFDRFKTFNRNSGTGIGLHITRVIVRKMGGEIKLTSPIYENSGTRFEFTLTLTRNKPVPAEVPKQFEYRVGVKILIADDEEINCRILKRKFANEVTWTTDTVQTLHGVLEKATQNKYDVIFLDEHFGIEQTGSVFIKTLRENGVDSKILIASANCSAMDEKLYTKRGADGTIPKPVPSRDELILMVNSILQ